jgi:hypothetical protein
MVFSQQPGNHNRVNIRDTSTDHTNLFGDAYIPKKTNPIMADEEDMPPPLESYKTPHQRRVNKLEQKG